MVVSVVFTPMEARTTGSVLSMTTELGGARLEEEDDDDEEEEVREAEAREEQRPHRSGLSLSPPASSSSCRACGNSFRRRWRGCRRRADRLLDGDNRDRGWHCQTDV